MNPEHLASQPPVRLARVNLPVVAGTGESRRRPPAHDPGEGEARGRRVATRALLLALMLVAFDDYGACGAPMTHHGVNR